MVYHPIPDIIISRLPLYLQALTNLRLKGLTTISSKELGEHIGISAAQIRKDLSQFGEFGKQGTGYSINFLIESVSAILNVDKVWDVVVIGAGDLGHALARYQGFANRGFRITAVFDNSTQKVGTRIGEFEVFDISTLKSYIQVHKIKIAMLTVPAPSAQEVADLLIETDISAILSYAPVTLILPERVHIEYIDPLLQLQHMTYYID